MVGPEGLDRAGAPAAYRLIAARFDLTIEEVGECRAASVS